MFSVSTEIGNLKRLLIHSPDSGLGKVVPSKAQDWLFEDIVHLDTMRRQEYDYYVKILMYFIDPERIMGKLSAIEADDNRSFFKPDSPGFHSSGRVLEFQKLLAEILENEAVKTKLVAAACAIEKEWFSTQAELCSLPANELAKTLIAGITPTGEMLFPPIPNLIFTRDLGITINNYLLLNRPKKQARSREALLAQYVFFNHPVFENDRLHILEIPDNETVFLLPDEEVEENLCTLEGGDVMMVAPKHLLIGISERTSIFAAKQVMKLLFEKQIVDKITLLRIPKKRDFMHIDTIFTQVKRNMWVLLSNLAKNTADKQNDALATAGLLPNTGRDTIHIVQFRRGNENEPRTIDTLETLLCEISVYDLDCNPGDVQFVYSGNAEFPYSVREQWTDSCNLLAIKEGVVIGYDRNNKTIEAFKKQGFTAIHAAELCQKLESGQLNTATLTDTFIMLPSAELSRARGGSHCMSMPLQRETI
jgi:arginine deiminase